MLVNDAEEREFFVWVDPDDWMVKHNIGLVGGMTHMPPPEEDAAPEHLLFVHNPNHRQGMVSRFHVGVVKSYAVEYDLERFRFSQFPTYPSRLHSMYLFQDRVSADKYRETHLSHVANRVLKRAITSGGYVFSTHDLGWIDFLRLGHTLDVATLNLCWRAYWRGESVEDYALQSMGAPWTVAPIVEALFYGRINFPNKDLTQSD